MSAMVIAPAAAARQWTDSLLVMVLLAALFGALSGVSGAVLSATGASLPTGPLIVLAATSFVVASMALAPRRGLVWAAVRRSRHRRLIREETVLADLYSLAQQHRDPLHAHEQAVLSALRGTRTGVRRSLEALEQQELASRDERGRWRITDAGRSRVEEERSWENGGEE